VSQISPPIRILAVVAVAFLAIYMAVLRPKSSTPAPAPTPSPAGNVHTGKPAVTQYGKAVQAAQGAAKATEDQMKAEGRSAGVAPADSTTAKSGSASSSSRSSSPSTAGAAVSATDLAGLPKPVARAIRRHQVLALLFWNGRSADDLAVRAALRHVEHFDGTVYTQAAPLKSIASYGRITRGVDVQQSPTVVVVDRKLKATTLVGYVDVDTIDQAVVDALRATGGIFNDAYLRQVNNACSSVSRDMFALPRPENLKQAHHDIGAINSRWGRFVSKFKALPAPAKWRAFKRATMSDLRVVTASNRRLVHSLGGHPTLVSVLHVLAAEDHVASPASRRFGHRMNHAGLIFCGSRG
jgi:hypothetical protein